MFGWPQEMDRQQILEELVAGHHPLLPPQDGEAVCAVHERQDREDEGGARSDGQDELETTTTTTRAWSRAWATRAHLVCHGAKPKTRSTMPAHQARG